MTRGGKRNGSGRPVRTEKEGRQPKVVLSCRVELETIAFLKQEEERTGLSVGELTELAIESLRRHPEDCPPDATQGEKPNLSTKG